MIQEKIDRLHRLDADIAYTIEAIDELRTSAERITSALTFAGGGVVTDHGNEELRIKLAQLTGELEKKTAEYAALKTELVDLIGRLPRQSLRSVAKGRLIDRLTWTEIASKTHYSQGHCRRLCADALEALEGASK